jgi:hypothetical protein
LPLPFIPSSKRREKKGVEEMQAPPRGFRGVPRYAVVYHNTFTLTVATFDVAPWSSCTVYWNVSVPRKPRLGM